jgi:hypothetical protein
VILKVVFSLHEVLISLDFIVTFRLLCSAKACEEKLRYAAYNCIAIDTDMNPWEGSWED